MNTCPLMYICVSGVCVSGNPTLCNADTVLHISQIANLDIGTKAGALPSRKCVVLRALHQLQITSCCKLQAQILQSFLCAVDHQNIQHYIILVKDYHCLSINSVRQACQLQSPSSRAAVFVRCGQACCTLQISGNSIFQLDLHACTAR